MARPLAAISTPAFGALPHSAEANVKIARPVRENLFRPNWSARRPAGTNSPAKERLYAFSTHVSTVETAENVHLLDRRNVVEFWETPPPEWSYRGRPQIPRACQGMSAPWAREMRRGISRIPAAAYTVQDQATEREETLSISIGSVTAGLRAVIQPETDAGHCRSILFCST
jgi:hypothetical protein